MPIEALIEKQPDSTPKADKLVFSHLPAYARFIKDHHFIPYIEEQIRESRKIALPLMKFIQGISDEDLVAMSVGPHTEFLAAVENNKLREQISRSLEKWIADDLGVMKRDELTAEDIIYAGYIRKKALIKFLPFYTTDVHEAVEITKEIDIFTVESGIAATNVYINLLKDRINEQTFFREKLSNTTPGLQYTFDLSDNSIKYANKNYLKFFGFTLQELQGIGPSIRKKVVHADDIALSAEGIERCKRAEDEEIISWEYRLRAANGEYVWMRNYAAVFKRDEQGMAVELVGIILDINIEKEIANKLMVREKQLLEAQRQAQVGSFELDVETGQMDVTPQFCEIYELTDFDLYKLIDHVHPADRERINANRDKAIADGSQYDNEYRYRINGHEKIIRSRGITSYKNGRRILTGTSQDVTERHKMVEELLESQARSKQAQELSHIGNWKWDMQTQICTWSEELFRIYELDAGNGNVRPEIAFAYRHPDDEQLVNETMQRLWDQHIPCDYNFRIILPSGVIKYLNVKADVSYDENVVTTVYGTVQDITEQKEVEKKIKDYQEFIEKITDVTPSIIAAYNIRTGMYSFINDAIENLLGYPATKVMEEGVAFLYTLLHPDDVPYIMEKNTAAIEDANQLRNNDNEPITEFKYRMLHKNGEYRWFHTYGTIFERNENGEVESVLNISIDITDQEAAEQALYQKNLQLQQSNTSLEEYAYVASHDLKEPLRKIATFSDRILTTQNDRLNDDGKVYLTKIIDASKRMQKMINDLLSVSTILGNNAFETCDLAAALEDALIPLEYKIEENKAVIEADKLPAISVVPSQFRQLFQNLVSNSLKFARTGVPTHIKITHKFLSPKAVEQYELTKAKKYLQIVFEDNGIGFENEYAAKIFAIFQRLHGKNEYDGTGIGLAICKKIVENHGGTIFAQGIVNQSAIFTIIIPV